MVMILFLAFFLVLILLDIAMLISLIRPGDERKQMVVWKASTYTLFATAGSMMIGIMEDIVRGKAIHMDPFVHLGTTAIIYFVLLVYYKRKYGG